MELMLISESIVNICRIAMVPNVRHKGISRSGPRLRRYVALEHWRKKDTHRLREKHCLRLFTFSSVMWMLKSEVFNYLSLFSRFL